MWGLDPSVTFLNHASFGACPSAVLQYQQELRNRLEREPVRFFLVDYPRLLDEARQALAAFLGAEPGDLAFVRNATVGVNTVLRGLPLGKGDQILTTDHAYEACRNAAAWVARSAGADVVTSKIPFPIASPDQAAEAILGSVTKQTRLALIEHVTSPTGLVLPIGRIVRELAQRGVETLVDGAHGPGMLPLDLGGLGAAYYVGNCHKWLCSPKGAAFLWVRRDLRDTVRPLVIGRGASAPPSERSRFHLEFDWTGTDDPTAWLSVPESIRVVGSALPGGWAEVMERNRRLALQARETLCRAVGTALPAPEDMIGSLAALPLGPSPNEGISAGLGPHPLAAKLLERYSIQVPVFSWPRPPGRVLRVSAQLYNRPEEYERLGVTLAELLRAESPGRTQS